MIKLIEKLLSILEKEDKKNPLTDEDIAKQLGRTREKVNELRLQHDIPGYLERREKLLIKNIEEIIKGSNEISLRRLSIELNKLGFKISTFGLTKYKIYVENLKTKGNLKSDKTISHSLRNAKITKQEEFSNIIGYMGSIAHVIKLSKAAILYPPNGLHTLIVGSTGVGKSQLVEQMHLFAKKVRGANIPLVTFNCADYSDNPQLLVSQLFGHTKGSFTGADSEKEGLIEKANNGIFFLDEIHRLPSKGQEILFRIIDKGEFNRLGETNNVRKINLMIVGATTESIDSNLLATFRRRIPVLIEIPSLEERPLIERMQIIKKFFKMEAIRITKELIISNDVIQSLLSYKCQGNIGQLKSDIQVTCARAFLNFISSTSHTVRIINSDMPSHLKEAAEKTADMELMNIKDMLITPTNIVASDSDEYNVFNNDIYQFIENRMEELKYKNYSIDEIREKISAELEERISAYTSSITNKYSDISQKLLKDIVGDEVISIVDDIRKVLITEIGNDDFSIYNVLCLHINTALERIRMGKPIINPNLEYIRANYRKEFKIALKITDIIKLKLGLDFLDDEAGFIALYLNRLFNKDKRMDKRKIGVIIVTHGEVAKVMIEVVQSILDVEHGVAICMALDEKPEEVYKRVKETSLKVNEGKGVIILVDMGSLITFGDLITEELGIPTRTIFRVDTLMLIEVLRKSVQENVTLDTVYNSIQELEMLLPRTIEVGNNGKDKVKKKAIIATCITGKGTALKIKEVVDEKLKNLNIKIEIIPLGLIENNGDILNSIKKIQGEREIVAAVGTINSEIDSIPFIPYEQIMCSDRFEIFANALKFRDENLILNNQEDSMETIFDSKIVRVFHSLGSKEEVINIMAMLMKKEGYVNEGFCRDVLDREEWGSSYIGKNVAVPHTSEPKNLVRPIIGIAILKNPMEWDDGVVDVIFILALGTEHKKLFLELFNIIKETDLIDKIKSLDNAKLIIQEVLDYANKYR